MVEYIFDKNVLDLMDNNSLLINYTCVNYTCVLNILLYLIARQLSYFIHIIPSNYCTHKYNVLIIFGILALFVPMIISLISMYVEFIESLCKILFDDFNDIDIIDDIDNSDNSDNIITKNIVNNNENNEKTKKFHIHFNTNNNIETMLEQIMTEGYPVKLF